MQTKHSSIPTSAAKPAGNADQRRRAAVERAVDALPSKQLRVTGNTIEEIVSKIFTLGHEMKPGEATKVIGLLPNETRDLVMRIALLYEKAEEMGRHGYQLQEDIAKKLGISLHKLMMFCEPLMVDDVARRVCEKRGNDAQRDIPPLTRRDQIEAALNAHTA